jgi:hypothetical protein
MATAGLHQKIAVFFASGGAPDIVGGIPKEIAAAAVAEWEGDFRPDGLFVEIEGFKCLLDRMAEEAGIDLLFCSRTSEVLIENDILKGVLFENASGRFAALGHRVIDCTGNGEVAFRAGCKMMHGRPEDGRMQPVTLMYRVGGVNRERVWKHFPGDPRLRDFCAEAAAKGLMRPWQSQMMGFWWIPSRPDQLGINFTHMHLDGAFAGDITRAFVEGRKQVQEAVRAMRALVPGFEKSYLIDTASYMGVRETRRIQGEYVLTAEDIKNQTRFEDGIGFGAAFIDIHNVEGPGMDKRSGYHLPAGGYYSIPYRTLIPGRIDGLLVAGRCHSATHEAAGSTRWMAQCMVMGQAAGTAAALSLDRNVPPRSLNADELRQRLETDGARV